MLSRLLNKYEIKCFNTFVCTVLDHGFFIAKVDFEFIAVQDMFGGPLIVKPADYFAVTPKQLYKYKNKLLGSRINYSVKRI